MLWSPSEVLAYLKDDLGLPSSKAEKRQTKLLPTAPFGGFQTWPSSKEDFILIAENSEIHGPNPLFTIPELDPSTDLNALSTQILSADYQGLSNNKILPGRNAQLLMPDLASDVHAAITYFFLFDTEARGFVRPTCLAYFTSDKHKLMMLAEPILKTLSEVSEILQHTNIQHHTNDLKAVKDAAISASPDSKNSASKEIFAEARLKDIQDILDIVEKYEGNNLFDKQLENIMEYLKKEGVTNKLKNLDSPVVSPASKASPSIDFAQRPNTKKHMKSLHHICYNGMVLGLYHLYIMYKHFRRKYENIVAAETFTAKKGCILHFGACVKSSVRLSSCPSSQNKCALHSYRVPATLSLESDSYFWCLDGIFEELLLRVIECDNNELDQSNSFKLSSSELTNSSEFTDSSSISSDYFSNESEMKEGNFNQLKCRHIASIGSIWDVIEHIKKENPGIEESFLSVLKLFGDTQRLLFSVLTRTPIIVISTLEQMHTAQNFIKALSIFIPRRNDEILFVDTNRQDSLKRDYFSNFAAINVCLYNEAIENLLPLEYLPSMCVLNLKDCSVTAPMYTGHLLSNVEERIKVLSSKGPVFAVFVNILTEVQRTIQWWNMLTSSSADFSSASEYVLSKGYNRLDIQIIEALSRLHKS